MQQNFWQPGERVKISDLSDITIQHISDILHRRRTVGKERAALLEIISGNVLDEPVPFEAWLFNKTTEHPAFFGEPK